MTDWDEDGNADLLVGILTGLDPPGISGVWILPGNGDGSFGAGFDLLPELVYGWFVTAADLNADGRQDLLFIAHDEPCDRYVGSGAVVLVRNADESFSHRFFGLSAPAQPLLRDLNSDGLVDMAFASGCHDCWVDPFDNCSFVSVMLATGDDTLFRSVHLFGGAGTWESSAYYPTNIAATDANRDGFLDLLALGIVDGEISMWPGQGEGTFGPRSELDLFPQGISSFQLADFDGDSRLDWLLNGTSCLFGNADGSFTEVAFQRPPGCRNADVILGDVNADGRRDFVSISRSTDAVAVYLARPDRTFDIDYAPTGSEPRAVVSMDLDGDGWRDLAVTNSASNSVSVFLAEGEGRFTPGVEFPTELSPSGIASGDFDRNGAPDLAVVNSASTSISVLLGDGAGGFERNFALPVGGSNLRWLATSDLDGDNFEDLLVANDAIRANGVAIIRGNGDGTFQPPSYVSGRAGPFAVLDWSKDGIPDLAVAINSIVFYQGVGDGTFVNRFSRIPGIEPVSIVAADLNGDDWLDIVTANRTDQSVSLLFWDGPRVDIPLASQPSSVAVDDVTGDGHLDLILTSPDQDVVSVLTGDGNGNFESAETLLVGCEPVALAVARLDGDSRPDIVTANRASNSISVLLSRLRPVAVTIEDFQALLSSSGVSLTWHLADDSRPLIAGILIERSPASQGPYSPLHASPLEPESDRFTDSSVIAGSTYWYRLVILGDGGKILGPTLRVETSSGARHPTLEVLGTISAGDEVRIRYEIVRAGASVRLAVYDIGGRRVRTLDRGTRDAGSYSILWDGHTDQGQEAARGVYLVELNADAMRFTRKVVLLRR